MAKWTARKLKNGIEDYFARISRTATVKESVPTGRKDDKGHEIFQMVEMLNGQGEPVVTEEWILPPSIQDMLHELGLTPEDWAEIKAEVKTAEIAMAAELRVERYLRRELLLRPNKAIKGVMLTLQNDFGFGGETPEAEGMGTLEDLIGGGGA